jgi:hypothetical protein
MRPISRPLYLITISPSACRDRGAATRVFFTIMTAAFGSTRPRKWLDYRLLENHSVLRAGGLRGTEITITRNGQSQVVQLEQEWTFGRQQRQRPWFCCPSCNRRCRNLHEKDGTFVCRLCSGYDYRSRHRNRSCPALNRVRRGTGLPHRALARERIIAEVELARLLRATVRDLQRRAKRGGK